MTMYWEPLDRQAVFVGLDDVRVFQLNGDLAFATVSSVP